MGAQEKTHIALPLKYRPMTFDDVVGQEHVTRTLRNALTAERIANAYLFVGPRGIGKTTLSRIFAKALNCKNPNGAEPCGKCDNCVEIAAGRSIDVTELDAASHNKVEDARMLMEHVNFPPTGSKYKVFIIDECHMLTPAAWNALLKTLEEPPPYVRFIFATTEGDKLLATIISRCQRFDLRRIQTHQIAARLKYICGKEEVNAHEDALLAIARGAEGGMRDALSSLDQLIAFKGNDITEEDALGVFGLVSRRSLENLAEAVLTGDAAQILHSVEEFDSAGKNMKRLSGELMQHFRNLIVYKALNGETAGLEATPDQIKTLAEQATKCNLQRLYRVADQISEMEDKLRYVLSVRTLIEMSLIRASRAATTATIDELLRAVAELQKRAPHITAGAVQAVAPVAAAAAPAAGAGAGAGAAGPAAAGSGQAVAAKPAAPAAPAAEKPKEPERAPLTPEQQRKIMDDPKLNEFLAALPGAKITEIK